ncbi:MAG: chemotaxis protein CheA [Betaproteobacteria bacterium RBG_16_56_24]|nr:MAG: chemotaxis protein CheA [Betaproteobacteria bacterium RBG_16_56_24]
MSIDMSQFYQVFFDESVEHLASMESLLLTLDLDSPDPDQLNAIFRAAHSIKGSSGTFGFTDMAEVTHDLETLLDRIRKNEIIITADMVDAFLQTGDVLRSLLDAHQRGIAVDGKASIEVRARLERLTDNIGQKTEDRGQSTVSEPAETSAQHTYQVNLPNTTAVFPSKAHLNNLLEELGNTGEITNKKITAKAVTLSLTTRASEAEIRDIFSFFLEPDQLTISETNATIRGTDQQDYGFFADPDAVKSGVENAQGYGFFADPDAVKSGVENVQGYGFFADPDAVKSGVENAQGYGFFEDIENHAGTQAPKPGLRQDDVPGRRATDKAVISTAGDNSIRVSVVKVDQMINLVGELVITQAMLTETVSNMDPVLHERLVSGLAQLERNTRDLQDSVMSVRMMPINLIFSRFQRVVRDGSGRLGKKIQLSIVGESTELDKGLIEKISDPLNHLVRNSMDHGIESPEERIANGKTPQGTITLRAAHQGGNIVIEVSDDGAGLNRERILAKAREKGLPVNDGMSDTEVWQIVFAPGFSTAAIVTDVSGRGVGMDVVKRNIESIGGRVEISSQHGKGCAITIRLPLTLAILDGLSIAVGDQIYIIPLNFISESLQPNSEDIKEISGQGQVVHVRGEYLPLIALHRLFNIQTKITNPAEGILVLMEAEGKKIALFVDELLGQHQVVIKSLESNYRKVAGVSGATIMGDGRVAMIMDVGGLAKLAQK